MATGFDALPLSERARDVVHRMGWREPTPIQAATLPHLLSGHDVVGEAETGSGKTGAFGLALAERVKGPGLAALVLVPTRELALQVEGALAQLGEGSELRPVAVYGGVPHGPQLAALARPETTCAVATPGRLLEFVRMGQVKLGGVQHAVLDEADRMLDMGFLPDVERILADLPRGRQLAMFSATFPPRIRALARRYLPTARQATPGEPLDLPEGASHFRIEVASSVKREALLAWILAESPRRCLIFARTREGADHLARWLGGKGVAARPLHGDLPQPAREAALAAFRDGTTPVLVATDVAARGLDVPSVTHVLNFDLPEGTEAYVHRAGRTARAGKAGVVVTLVTEQDRHLLPRIVQRLPVQVRSRTLPGFPPPPEDAGSEGRRSAGPPPKKMDKKRMKPGWVDRGRR